MIREQILTQLKANLMTISKANGYQTDMGRKVRGPFGRPVSKNDLPVIIVRDNGAIAQVEERTNAHTRDMQVSIRGILALQETASSSLYEVYADVMKALGEAERDIIDIARLANNEIVYEEDEIGVIDNELLYEGFEIKLSIRYVAERWKV